MPTMYDKRRPRIPAELGQKIDAARGQVAFDAFVRGAVEAALSDDTHGREPRGASSGHSHAEHYASATGAASARGASRPAASPRPSAPKVDRVMEAHRSLPKPRRADYATGEQWQDAVRVWKAQR